MAKKEVLEIKEVVSKEIPQVVNHESLVIVKFKDEEIEVSGDVANALIHAKRAELVK